MHQGTYISDRTEKPDEIVGKDFDPQKLVSYIHNDKFTLPEQRRELDLLEQLDQLRNTHERIHDPQLEAAVQSMEVAYRMQTEAPEVFDIRKESEATLNLYGPGSTARGCLMAVRLVERGVRMVQVYYAKRDPWDAHNDIQAHRKNAKDSDQPFAAVIKDLKSRGPARPDARHLRIGVRPDAGVRDREQRAAAERARSQSVRLHGLDGGRRHQGAAPSTARPTTSASRPSTSPYTSTTCTRRSST